MTDNTTGELIEEWKLFQESSKELFRAIEPDISLPRREPLDDLIDKTIIALEAKQELVNSLTEKLRKYMVGECDCPKADNPHPDAVHWPGCPVIMKEKLAASEAWYPVDVMLPEPGKPVIAVYVTAYGKTRRIRVQYLPRYFLEDEFADADEGCTEYNEEKDAYFYEEGWWEMMDCWDEYGFVRCNEEIKAWTEMPKVPQSLLDKEET